MECLHFLMKTSEQQKRKRIFFIAYLNRCTIVENNARIIASNIRCVHSSLTALKKTLNTHTHICTHAYVYTLK